MALEIMTNSVNFERWPRCGGCFATAASPNVVEGGPIMVAPGSRTDRRTKLGDSSKFGHVRVDAGHASAFTSESDRHAHLSVLIATDGAKRKKGGVITLDHVAIAHDLKPLP